jgi:uncharacterized iron-regulated membrane protein
VRSLRGCCVAGLSSRRFGLRPLLASIPRQSVQLGRTDGYPSHTSRTHWCVVQWAGNGAYGLGRDWHVRRLILTLHLSVALIGGAFFLVLGLTGSLMAFEPELDRLFHAHLSYVRPSGIPLSLAEIGDSVSRQFRGEPIVAYLSSESPDLSWQVILPSGIVCVNQYTGEVLGTRTRGQTVLGLAHDVHVRLATGDVGRTVMKWSGLGMLVSLASGLYLWWPAKRVRIRAGWRTAGFWFDLHNSVGVLTLVPLLVMALTGTVTGFEEQAGAWVSKLTRPSQVGGRPSVARPQPAPGSPMITADQAVSIARGEMPGAIPYRVQMPQYGGAYRVSLDDPRDRVAGGLNQVAIDQFSGQVIFSRRSSDLSASDRILATNEAVHTGSVLGMPGKFVVWLISVIVPVQVISGLLVWLRRKWYFGS